MSAVPNSALNYLGLVPKTSPVYSVNGSANGAETATSHQATVEATAPPQIQNCETRVVPSPRPVVKKAKRNLHRIAEVRISQGVSERTMCRRLNIDIKQLRAIEDPAHDLCLSELAEIRDALEVPFADLLVENDNLSRPVQERAQMLKIMKTAVSIKECKLPPRAARLAQMLCEQMIALMPELAEVGGWPEFGSRRGSDSVAKILASEIDTSNIRSE